MRKLLSLVFFSTLFFSFIADATVVRPTPRLGRSIWRNVRDSTPTPIENADADGADLITIDAPGQYQLYENITNKILIKPDLSTDPLDPLFVSLDLNGYEVAYDGNGLADGIIQIEASNVAIFNGFVRNTNDDEYGVGIWSRSNRTLVERVTVSNCERGVVLQGDGCELIELNLIENTGGVTLGTANSNIIMDCTSIGGPGASQSEGYGFELENSSANCFYNCEALDMSSNYTTAGFKTTGDGTTGGGTNLFYQCVAKGITTIETDFCSKAYGFWLTGEEEKTKIIDCIVNDISAEGDAVAYGIHLHPTILTENILDIVATSSYIGLDPLDGGAKTEAPFYGVSWSPNGKILFAIAPRAVTDESELSKRILYGFDGERVDPVFSVDDGTNELSKNPLFSPDGRYVAYTLKDNVAEQAKVVIDTLDGMELLNPTINPSAQIVFTELVGAADNIDFNDLAWSASGKYLAVTLRKTDLLSPDPDKYLDQVLVLCFDGSDLHKVSRITSNTYELDENTKKFTSVAWSPDEQFIAVGTDDGFVKIFLFRGSNLLEEVATELDLGDGYPVESLVWSPNGKFIAAVQSDGLSNGALSVAEFEYISGGATLSGTLSLVDRVGGLVPIQSVDWSPCGKYLVSPEADAKVAIWPFLGTAIDVDGKLESASLGAPAVSVNWCSCGSKIAVATASNEDETEPIEPTAFLYILDAMTCPVHCLLEKNTVSDVRAANSVVGTGITGGCSNCFFGNICCDNDVDFSFGVPNVFYDDYNTQRPFDNIATQRPRFLMFADPSELYAGLSVSMAMA